MLRNGMRTLLTGVGISLALAGCMSEPVDVTLAPVPAAPASHAVQPGTAVRAGAQTSGMAAQYAGARKGAVAATGASAWVSPAPPPAFVVTDLPPAAPPAQPPAAVANRQPAPLPAADPSQIVRPEAAAPEPAAPAAPPLNAATREEGRRLFANYSCNACHALADASAMGVVGPSLDSPGLTRDVVIEVVTSGRGAMPSFAGQMTDAEIATLASYIVGAARQ